MIHSAWYRNLISRFKTDDARTNVAALLSREPPPLINPPEDFGMIWSAKSGSMATMVWFLCRLGMFESLRDYSEPANPRPHSFRRFVLTKSPEYQHWVAACDPTALKWLRIIRSPYNRAVSSYRHALSRGYEDRKIEKRLGLSVEERGLSFDEFLDYLLAIDVANCNIHHRQQWHPLEEYVAVQKIMNIDKEPWLPALMQFETENGLSPLSAETLAGMLDICQVIARRHHSHRLETPNQDCVSVRFTRAEANGPWPAYEAFLNADTRLKIERIYAKDFATYADFL
jgi:hypothetical protein